MGWYKTCCISSLYSERQSLHILLKQIQMIVCIIKLTLSIIFFSTFPKGGSSFFWLLCINYMLQVLQCRIYINAEGMYGLALWKWHFMLIVESRPLKLQQLRALAQFLSHPDGYFVNDQFLRQRTVWLPQVLQRSLEHTLDILYTRLHDAPVSLLSLRSHLSPTRCLPQGTLSLRGHFLSDRPWYENNCQYVNVRHSELLWAHLAATHFSGHMSTPDRRPKKKHLF